MQIDRRVIMKILRNEEIEKGISATGRVYLCGNLAKPNGIEHFPTNGYEIGISCYQKYTCEKAHYHSANTEYNYVLEGCIKILLLNEEKEYQFKKGDMFIINVGEPYIGKSMAGTKIIFSKDPGGNDKVLFPMDDAVTRWGKSWDSSYTKEN